MCDLSGQSTRGHKNRVVRVHYAHNFFDDSIHVTRTVRCQSQKSQSQLYCQFCHMYRTYIQRIEIALLSYSLVHTDNTKHKQ